MESGFQELAERLNDGGYKNWLKASQCLSLLQGALRPFATSHMSAFHGQLLQRHGPLRVPSEARCRVRGNTVSFVWYLAVRVAHPELATGSLQWTGGVKTGNQSGMWS